MMPRLRALPRPRPAWPWHAATRLPFVSLSEQLLFAVLRRVVRPSPRIVLAYIASRFTSLRFLRFTGHLTHLHGRVARTRPRAEGVRHRALFWARYTERPDQSP